ncbi:MAG: hypothetical protein IM638_14710 [Bacteroidetes bacterium]|nr:hypothetical protein [Bacteroidota bacterium]
MAVSSGVIIRAEKLSIDSVVISVTGRAEFFPAVVLVFSITGFVFTAGVFDFTGVFFAGLTGAVFVVVFTGALFLATVLVAAVFFAVLAAGAFVFFATVTAAAGLAVVFSLVLFLRAISLMLYEIISCFHYQREDIPQARGICLF